MRLLSTRELADALGVSESSTKRWIDAGKIAASRTEGGHRRIELAAALRFVRETGAPLARPEILELPPGAQAQRAAADRLLPFLRDGDAAGAHAWLVARYLAGASIAELSDGPIREAMHALGELWHYDDDGIFIEHRATDACLTAIAQLRARTPAVPASARVAIGGSPAGDPYLLSSQLAASVAADAGMRAINLGPDTPVTAFEHATAKHQPRLVWLSISTAVAPSRARSLVRWLAKLPAWTAIVIGGRNAATLGDVPDRVHRFGTMVELAELAASIASRPSSKR